MLRLYQTSTDFSILLLTVAAAVAFAAVAAAYRLTSFFILNQLGDNDRNDCDYNQEYNNRTDIFRYKG